MEILQETTSNWNTTYRVPQHSYIVEGAKMIGYIPEGTTEPVIFKAAQSFSKSGRTFKRLGAFKLAKPETRRKVVGSKGNVYLVDDAAGTCTCAGFTYRGYCKHLHT